MNFTLPMVQELYKKTNDPQKTLEHLKMLYKYEEDKNDPYASMLRKDIITLQKKISKENYEHIIRG